MWRQTVPPFRSRRPGPCRLWDWRAWCSSSAVASVSQESGSRGDRPPHPYLKSPIAGRPAGLALAVIPMNIKPLPPAKGDQPMIKASGLQGDGAMPYLGHATAIKGEHDEL